MRGLAADPRSKLIFSTVLTDARERLKSQQAEAVV